MKYKQILLGLLSTAFKNGGETVEKLNELLEGDEESLDEKEVLKLFSDADKDRVKEIRTKYHDEGYKKAEAKIMSSFEKELREKFELGDDVDLKGVDLVSHLIESKTSKGGKDLSEDAIKRSPVYIQLQDQLKKLAADKDKEWQQKLDETVKSYSKEKIFNNVSSKALEILDSLKPILSSDPQKAAKQKQILLNELKGYEFDEVDGKIVVMKDGKVVEDDHGYRVDFAEIVKTHASEYFDFQAAKEDRTAPNSNNPSNSGSQGKSSYSGKLPKSEEEYSQMISDENIPLAERVQIKEAWQAQKTNQ